MEESNLVKHARYELQRAGLFDAEGDYGGMLGHSTMKLIEVFAAEGHSGYSASLQVHIFSRLASFKTLTPITNDPEEWFEFTSGQWQNKRQSSLFSTDGGRTYYDIDEKERTIKTAEADHGKK